VLVVMVELGPGVVVWEKQQVLCAGPCNKCRKHRGDCSRGVLQGAGRQAAWRTAPHPPLSLLGVIHCQGSGTGSYV
jgi:hypothetical protein